MPGSLTASKGFFGSVGKTGTSPGLTSSAKAELKTSLRFGEEEDILLLTNNDNIPKNSIEQKHTSADFENVANALEEAFPKKSR